jgi:hypothetical protein
MLNRRSIWPNTVSATAYSPSAISPLTGALAEISDYLAFITIFTMGMYTIRPAPVPAPQPGPALA